MNYQRIDRGLIEDVSRTYIQAGTSFNAYKIENFKKCIGPED